MGRLAIGYWLFVVGAVGSDELNVTNDEQGRETDGEWKNGAEPFIRSSFLILPSAFRTLEGKNFHRGGSMSAEKKRQAGYLW